MQLIDIEILEEIKHVVVHGNCADGMASAIILAAVYPDAKVTFGIYGQKEYENILAEPGMIFCDIIPPKDRVDEFVAVDAIVLDHHKHAKDIIQKYKFHAFADEKEDPGVSGALLAYKNVYVPMMGEDETLEHFAKLAGIRDTWQKNSQFWVDACIQAETLEFYPGDYWLQGPEVFITDEEEQVGEIIYQKKIKFIEKAAEECYFVKIGEYKAAIFQSQDSSDLSDYLRDNFGTNICMGFNYYCRDNKIYIGYSCRSDGSFDVGALAKHFGGGGHSKASGFRREINYLDSVNPYLFTKALIMDYLDQASRLK